MNKKQKRAVKILGAIIILMLVLLILLDILGLVIRLGVLGWLHRFRRQLLEGHDAGRNR